MKLVLVDLWGTLIQLPEESTVEHIINELQLDIKHHELVALCDKHGLFSKTINPLIIWESVLTSKGLDPRLAVKANDLWINSSRNIRLFPQTKEFLTQLKKQGHRLVLASAIDKDSFDLIEKQFSFKEYFDEIQTTFQVGLGKSPEYYTAICQALQADPNKTIMIGDNIQYDILPADRVGLQTVFLSRFLLTDYQKDSLPQNTLVCKTYDEVLEHLS